MTPAQCREARRLLGWSQSRLARAAGLSQGYISQFEITGHLPLPTYGHENRMGDLRAALEAAGIQFTDGEEPGVKLRRPDS